MTQCALLNCQGTLVERFGLLVAAPVQVEPSQSGEDVGSIKVLRAEHLFAHGQGA